MPNGRLASVTLQRLVHKGEKPGGNNHIVLKNYDFPILFAEFAYAVNDGPCKPEILISLNNGN